MIVLVAATLGGGNDGGGSTPAGRPSQDQSRAHVPRFYEVESGDTLTAIAHETGVPVARILRLNPGVDPQILVSGEKLKLR